MKEKKRKSKRKKTGSGASHVQPISKLSVLAPQDISVGFSTCSLQGAGGRTEIAPWCPDESTWVDNPAMVRAYQKVLRSAAWTIGPSEHICKSEYTGTFTGADLIQEGILKLVEKEQEDKAKTKGPKMEDSKLQNLFKKGARAKRNVETRKKNRRLGLTEKYWAHLTPYLDHSHNPYSTLYGREGLSLIFRAMVQLWKENPNWAIAFFLRNVLEIERKMVGRLMGVKRLATINEWVNKAMEFLEAELPPREDLI